MGHFYSEFNCSPATVFKHPDTFYIITRDLKRVVY